MTLSLRLMLTFSLASFASSIRVDANSVLEALEHEPWRPPIRTVEHGITREPLRGDYESEGQMLARIERENKDKFRECIAILKDHDADSEARVNAMKEFVKLPPSKKMLFNTMVYFVTGDAELIQAAWDGLQQIFTKRTPPKNNGAAWKAIYPTVAQAAEELEAALTKHGLSEQQQQLLNTLKEWVQTTRVDGTSVLEEEEVLEAKEHEHIEHVAVPTSAWRPPAPKTPMQDFLDGEYETEGQMQARVAEENKVKYLAILQDSNADPEAHVNAMKEFVKLGDKLHSQRFAKEVLHHIMVHFVTGDQEMVSAAWAGLQHILTTRTKDGGQRWIKLYPTIAEVAGEVETELTEQGLSEQQQTVLGLLKEWVAKTKV